MTPTQPPEPTGEPTAGAKPTALYRYFDDKDRLLYVGISGSLGGRHKTHISSSRWMELTARSEIVRYPTREEAAEAEIEAIKTEQPLFNKQHNDTPEARAWLSAYLREIGRTDLESVPRAVRLLPVQDPQPAPPTREGRPIDAISAAMDVFGDLVEMLKDMTVVLKDLQARADLFERVTELVEVHALATDHVADLLMETRARLDEAERRMDPPPRPR